MNSNRKVTNLFLLGIAIASIILSPFVLDFTLTTRFIALPLFFLLALITLYKSHVKLTIKLDPLLLFYLAYVCFCIGSITWSTNKAEAIFESCKLLLGLLVFLFTFFSLKKDDSHFVENLLKISVVLCLLEFVITCVQLRGIETINKEALYHITGMNGHKNLCSSFLFLNLFFLIGAIIKLPTRWKLLAGISLVLTITIIIFLKTKAVLIGIIIALLVWFSIYVYQLIREKIKLKVSVYGVLVSAVILANIVFMVLLPPIINKSIEYNKRVTSSAETKKAKAELDEERLVIWNKTYQVIKKHPAIGVGMGNWQVHYPDATLSGLWRCEDLNVTFQRPHNDFLWILSEVGLIGFNLFLLFIVGIIVFLIKILDYSSSNKWLNEPILCCLFIIGYFSISFFDFPKERIEHTIWINIILGISYYHIKNNSSLPALKSLLINKNGLLAIIVSLLLIVSIGILRYKGEYHIRKMYYYKATNSNSKVISSCKSALSFAYTLDPTSVPINWYIGNANAALGNYQNAQEDFKIAYDLNPYNRNVVNDLASSYAFTKATDLAKKHYEEAARISPRFDDPKLNLAALYIQEGNYTMASTWLHSLLHDSERRSNYQKIVDINTQNN